MEQRKEFERKRIREHYTGKGVILDRLRDDCVLCCGSGNAVPTIYGFLLKGIRKKKEFFYYVTYIKIPDLQYLYVGEEAFDEVAPCLKRRKERARYFPMYGFSSLNKIY